MVYPIIAEADAAQAIARDVEAIGRISAVASILRIVCAHTRMGFAAIARVTDGTWTACAVQDDIAFGLMPGGQLPVETTLCKESRELRIPIVIDHASKDPHYCNHHTPRLYKIESYISVPIVMPNGDYFGNLCAIDPRPATLSGPETVAMFVSFAELIALQLENEYRREQAESALLDEREAAKLREQFIAVLGHDLRNPLSAITSGADIFSLSAPTAELKAIAKMMKSSTRRMLGLIDDVLDFARARLGSGLDIALAPEDDMATALHETVAELRAVHPGRVIEEHIDMAIDSRINCNRSRIQQLLSNLLGNALTHGAVDRPITVSAFIEAPHFILQVSNHGNPIPQSELAKIFDPYQRAANSTHEGGLGLGLYICAQIIKTHHGELTVSSSAESGTTFVAKLPIT